MATNQYTFVFRILGALLAPTHLAVGYGGRTGSLRKQVIFMEDTCWQSFGLNFEGEGF